MEYFDFKPSQDILICIDSDGCAMDTMTVKHEKCFGPEYIKLFGLMEYENEALEYWNYVNLYSKTRGINRFKGLSIALCEMENRKGIGIEGLEEFKAWTDNAIELSNQALLVECQKRKNKCMERALLWSIHVNVAITELPKNNKPFVYVKKTMDIMCQKADLAAVSSANGQAVQDEWTKYGLKEDCKVLLSQEAGSKAYCISELLRMGYTKNKTLMVGDAPGDWDSAKENGVFFFPILVGKESESWKELLEEAYPKLLEGIFTDQYQEQLMKRFNENLGIK